jgi:hypothetical protein
LEEELKTAKLMEWTSLSSNESTAVASPNGSAGGLPISVTTAIQGRIREIILQRRNYQSYHNAKAKGAVHLRSTTLRMEKKSTH